MCACVNKKGVSNQISDSQVYMSIVMQGATSTSLDMIERKRQNHICYTNNHYMQARQIFGLSMCNTQCKFVNFNMQQAQ